MIKKINVLEIVDSFVYAGTQRVLVNFCKHIDKTIFNVFACAYNVGGPREKDLANYSIPYLIAKNDVQNILDFILNSKIDIIHFHRSGHFIPIELEIMKMVKELMPFVVIIETNVFGKFDKKSNTYIDCSLQISKMMMNERYVKNVGCFDFKKMKVLYYPVDILSFEKNIILESEKQKYKEKIGISEGDFVVGKMGRPDVSKWSDLLLYMMPYLVKAVPNIKFIIQTIPESRKKLLMKSEYKDKYIFLDETSDDREVSMFYSIIDVYVHASKIGESFGMTLAEAGIFKKPVVVNSTPNRDNNQIELIDHLSTGIIANSPQSFARAVEYLYENSNKRIEFGENGYKKVDSLYNAKKITKQLEKIIIEQMLEKGYVVDSEIMKLYATGNFNIISEKEILNFKSEYQQRLKLEFWKLTLLEKTINFLYFPKKFYRKIFDFIEHKTRKD